MPSAQAIVKTAKASEYMQLLCKHFKLKVPSEFDAVSGNIDFKPGLCEMRVEGEAFKIQCQAEDEKALERVKYIVTDHVVRFGKRDALEIDWQSS